MSLRSRHGTAKKHGLGPVVEVPPADELRPARVAAPAPAPSGPIARRSDGKIDGHEAARELGRRGALARAKKRALVEAFATRVRLPVNVDALPGFKPATYYAPYAEEAEAALPAVLTQLAAESDGVLSPAVSSIARSGVQQTYAGRFLMDLATGAAYAFETGGATPNPAPNAALMVQASRLLEAGRQSMLAAHHLQALEAEARARNVDPDEDAPWAVTRKPEASDDVR